jgi:hypothetical protein
VAPGQGFLEVLRAGRNRWDLVANLPESRGELRGRLEGLLPRLSLTSGLLRGRIPVSGSALVDADGLHLDLFAQGEFFQEEFVRP